MSPIKKLSRGLSPTNEDVSLGRYSQVGKIIQCPHCKGEEFKIGEAQLNTAIATLFKLDWANQSATILTCTSCGYIQWFENQPSRVK